MLPFLFVPKIIDKKINKPSKPPVHDTKKRCCGCWLFN